MGVFIDKKVDSALYLDAVVEASSMIRNASLLGTNGYCIRCKTEIDYDPYKPLCDACYGTWAKYMNEQFEEKCWHSCGKGTATTYGQPECKSCYKRRSAA